MVSMVAEKVVVNESLRCWVGKEVFVVGNETIVNVAVVIEVEVGVAQEIVVELLPGVFDMATLHRLVTAGSQSRRHEFAGMYGYMPGKYKC